MPVNNELKKKEFPMKLKFWKKPTTDFKNNLKSISVKLIMSPSIKDIEKTCIPFANATWVDEPWDEKKMSENMSEETKALFLHHIFQRKILPQTLENISLTFLIDGISLQEVTHILRTRRATFSAECSGDKFLTDKEFLVPTAIENSIGSGWNVDGVAKENNFYGRYKEICLAAKKLYQDMVNTKEISIQDARYIMPRCLETFYYMRMDLGEAMRFISDRVDRQIQPQDDNVVAYGMMLELCRRYPILTKTIGAQTMNKKAEWYCKTARQFRSTNWFRPNKDNDCFEYNENDFVYEKQRDALLGTNAVFCEDVFTQIFESTKEELESIEKLVDEKYGENFFDKDLTKEEMEWAYES